MAPDTETDEPDEAWEAEQRERVAYEIAHPVWNPQLQPDGSYRDADAERRSDLASLPMTSRHRRSQPIAVRP